MTSCDKLGSAEIIGKTASLSYYKVVTGFVCEGHNNCELPVGIYNICECLVWVGRRCSARCGVDIYD